VRLGVLILPEDPWPVAAAKWQRAERLGFDHAWTYDHLAWRSLRDSPWYGAVPTLAAAAAVTSTIRLGTLVASPEVRHPVPFARELVTLDEIAGGRFTLGVGAGSGGWDATVLGQPRWSPDERADRFAEFVDLLDRLLCNPETTFHGRYWQAHEARTTPGCVQQPRIPFGIAATRPRSMRVAARHGSLWVSSGPRTHGGPPLPAAEGAAAIARQLARLDAACVAEGRDPATLDRLVLTGPLLDGGLGSREAFREVRDAYAALGVTDLVVHWPRPSPPYEGDEAILEAIAADQGPGGGAPTRSIDGNQ
jgi:alkanesulfonate monooxygenase SsuD/methylene tetrahydromethanopterin reductase-like flavin-dependent oxidoreductase (luciferase family)